LRGVNTDESTEKNSVFVSSYWYILTMPVGLSADCGRDMANLDPSLETDISDILEYGNASTVDSKSHDF
jgi:hypothetical protein